jgi:hypothetical protein
MSECYAICWSVIHNVGVSSGFTAYQRERLNRPRKQMRIQVRRSVKKKRMPIRVQVNLKHVPPWRSPLQVQIFLRQVMAGGLKSLP